MDFLLSRRTFVYVEGGGAFLSEDDVDLGQTYVLFGVGVRF